MTLGANLFDVLGALLDIHGHLTQSFTALVDLVQIISISEATSLGAWTTVEKRMVFPNEVLLVYFEALSVPSNRGLFSFLDQYFHVR